MGGTGQWCSNSELTLLAWQVRSGPCDLLVRLHRRVGLPEGPGHPAQGPLPDGHRHPATCQPEGPNAAIKGGVEDGGGGLSGDETFYVRQKGREKKDE